MHGKWILENTHGVGKTKSVAAVDRLVLVVTLRKKFDYIFSLYCGSNRIILNCGKNCHFTNKIHSENSWGHQNTRF